jgi:hypothetical protein
MPYAEHHRKEKQKENFDRWKKKNPERFLHFVRESARRSRLRGRIEVLSYYGKGKKAVCRWRGCKVADLDMLTLDHTLNNGSQPNQRTGLRAGGVVMKATMIKLDWPETFQTLCWNHQWKKENMRRRAELLGGKRYLARRKYQRKEAL